MFSFISFHGHILAHRDFYLTGIPVAQAASSQWKVVQLDPASNSLQGFADIAVGVVEEGDNRGLVTLGDGTNFLCANQHAELAWMPHV